MSREEIDIVLNYGRQLKERVAELEKENQDLRLKLIEKEKEKNNG